MIEKLRSIFEISHRYTEEGFLLKSYKSIQAGKELVLVFNPVCVNIELISPLLNELSRFYSVLTWESRGTFIPGDVSIISANNLNAKKLIDDTLRILDEEGIKKISHIVAYSSGCEAAASTLESLSKFSYTSISFISPSFKFKTTKKNVIQSTAEGMWSKVVARGGEYIQMLKDMTSASNSQSSDSAEDLSRRPFRHDETILMYAHLHNDFFSIDHEKIVLAINKNLLIVHAEDDDTVHPDVASYIHKNISSSELKLIPKGGHFVFYYDFVFVEVVLSFLWSQ